MATQSRIIIADSSPLYRQGFGLAVGQAGLKNDRIEVDCFADVLLELNRGQSIKLLVIDSCLPGLTSFAALKATAREHNVPILLVGCSDDPAFVRRAMFNGVNGVVCKSSDMDALTNAISKVAEGGYWRPAEDPDSRVQRREAAFFAYSLRRLSNQERNVLNLVKDGLRNKQIAMQMSVTEHTIKSHMSSILRKLNIENRTRLVMAVQQLPASEPHLRSA